MLFSYIKIALWRGRAARAKDSVRAESMPMAESFLNLS